MGTPTARRVRTAVVAGLAALVLPLTVAASCEGGDGDDDSPGVEQNDDDGGDDEGD